MTKKITIAIDAMGGENSPFKTIKAIDYFCIKNKNNKDFLINIFGDEDKIKKELNKYTLNKNCIKIIHTSSVVSDEETPLLQLKIQKIQVCGIVFSHRSANSDISLSAGNTGVLLVISRMILKMMNEVSKPALAVFGLIKMV